MTFESVNRAFSKQSIGYDAEDMNNIILQDLRQQVYAHVACWMKPNSNILELNAGTGIDACHFVEQGHNVFATDVSDGMIHQINRKIEERSLSEKLRCQQLSYDQLNLLNGQKFDYVFSNFGGLNCIEDLSMVTQHLPALLNRGAYVTFVIMPRVCPWELLWLFKGHFNAAFRRFTRNGVVAHLEGEFFNTYYFSRTDAIKSFGDRFTFKASEGLASLSPPPSKGNFPANYQWIYRSLREVDEAFRNYFPFNRWGDHIILTVQFAS